MCIKARGGGFRAGSSRYNSRNSGSAILPVDNLGTASNTAIGPAIPHTRSELIEMMRTSLACVAVLLCGCTLTPKQRAEVERAAEMQRDSRIIDEPPIRSEFQQLADEAFDNSSAAAPRHYLSLLNVGEDALLARIHLIRAARTSIDLQTFIWVDDDTGRLIFTELLKAARRGVNVRLIVDHFCKTDDPKHYGVPLKRKTQQSGLLASSRT